MYVFFFFYPTKNFLFCLSLKLTPQYPYERVALEDHLMHFLPDTDMRGTFRFWLLITGFAFIMIVTVEFFPQRIFMLVPALLGGVFLTWRNEDRLPEDWHRIQAVVTGVAFAGGMRIYFTAPSSTSSLESGVNAFGMASLLSIVVVGSHLVTQDWWEKRKQRSAEELV
jgi:hypothetical protein